ncbi:MAG TPA: serine/threonine-protein kinase [Nitrospira sp.]|nr:serine/threonine-protein kinase [Nitrospira sp.]
MDPTRADFMQKELNGKMVAGWVVGRVIGNGASAVVFEATRDGLTAALKVLDRELVAKVSEAQQLARVNRERELIGKEHPNLVKILDGGKCPESGLLFIVMECLTWQELRKVIGEIPRARIAPIIEQLASAAEFLEDLGIAHRDIKPANILISPDFKVIKLMDLGIIKPIGEEGLTDSEKKPFIGTHQYSPPEFIHRLEENDKEGWRAVTFYQIGAVLHDLIMRRPIFQNAAHRTADLVNAIESDRPVIDAPDVPADLRSLAAMCLSKDSEKRRRVLKWSSFHQPQTTPTVNTVRERLRELQTSLTGPSEAVTTKGVVDELVLDGLVNCIKDSIRQETIKHSDRLPPVIFADVERSAATMTFSATYGPSPTHLLSAMLYIRYKVGLIDSMMRVLDICACATLSSGEPSNECFSDYSSVFQGAYIEELCTPRVLTALYMAVTNAATVQAQVNKCYAINCN